MPSIKRQIVALILVLATALGVNVSVSPIAVGAETSACVSELKIKDVPSAADAAAKTPAILVHGWKGTTGSFASLDDFLKSDSVATHLFNYESANEKWVTDGDTASKLAKTIVCYSRLYGGKDVVIVAHSMGGLLTRAALDWAAYGTRAKDVTGHVITISTPHQGSLLANADSSFWLALCKAPIGVFSLTDDIDALCRQAESGRATVGMSVNSDQLANLPVFPSGVSVRAIAGDVSVKSCAVWGCSSEDTNGDLVVSETSATALYTSDGTGDGTRTFACEGLTYNVAMDNSWCSHSNMLWAPQVQADVKESIRQYITSAKSKPVQTESSKPSATGKAYTMNGMTLRLDPDWDVRGTESNGWSVKTDETYAGYYTAGFEVADFSWLGSQSVASYGDFPECTDKDHSNRNAKLVRQGERRIGNKTATYYTAHLCTDGAARNELFRVWEVNTGGKKIVINTTEWPRYGVTNLDGILAGATWQ